MAMTPDAKSKLSKVIRGTQNGAGGLRAQLLRDLHDATESAYRMGIRLQNADLKAAPKEKRRRLESWIAEQVRAESGKHQRDHNDFRRMAEKQAAYTLLNRLVFLRLLEAAGLRKPLVVTGGWDSRGYKDFREIAPALCDVRHDESEGYAFLLRLIFEDLATDLPGLYGSAGVAGFIPVPVFTLRAVVEAFDDPELQSCWTDDMTLGWVYQYWNDPDREALDAKINDGGKIEPHEIASKTQMFTERYMVDWLLQNSLGPMWLAMCKKHGWTPEVEANGTLEALEQRRVEWRAKRDAGEVSLTELMPLHTEAERRWAYYVPQPIPDDAVEHAPDSVRDLKILDPAVGSGHFLVVAFDLLFALYEEEARHRGRSFNGEPEATACGVNGEPKATASGVAGNADASGSPLNDENWSSQAITERILEHNLHGIDLDPRAVQIAAAALWLKARQGSPEGQPRQLNLVASNLGIASLPDNDPALVELRRTVEAETGIPAKLTNSIVEALRGADHLGSLLKVDAAIETAIAEHEKTLNWDQNVQQLNLFADGRIEQRKLHFPRERMEVNLLSALESFLSRHTSAQELGLRLRGEQLAAGVRFVRMVREGSYDLVVATPPYQGTSKMAAGKYIEQQYPLGKADLFAAFLLRGLELVREGGVSSMLTMRNWMFIKQYSALREHLLGTFDLRAIGDFDRGAFEDVPDEVVSVAVASFARGTHHGESIALCPTPRGDRTRDNERTSRKRAATLCHVGRHNFDPAALKVVPEWPLVYWWSDELLRGYQASPLLGDVAPVRTGLCTSDNTRFLRKQWEVAGLVGKAFDRWHPYVTGARGMAWFDPCDERCPWDANGLLIKTYNELLYTSFSRTVQNEEYYDRVGIAYTPIGACFSARVFRRNAIMGKMGSSVFPTSIPETLAAMNSERVSEVIVSLNPGVHFEVGDVNRLPLFPIANADEIFAQVEAAFTIHESHREPSVEFQQPGPSPWRYAQAWAQVAVDRPENSPLPEYVEQLDPEPPTDHLSFALGFALGRFGADGEEILDPGSGQSSHHAPRDEPSTPPDRAAERTLTTHNASSVKARHAERDGYFDALPHGILFLNGTLTDSDLRDSLGHPAAQIIHTQWDEYGAAILAGKKSVSVRDWLREKFFADVHRQMYENRPIHWPLSSAKKSFVAWINIHRWKASTLRVLLADHLQPALTRLDGELADLRSARDGADKKAATAAERRFAQVKGWREELVEFIANVEQCAERGPAPPDPKKPERETDARYDPDLDDGVMINSAALWPLLEPQWKDPKKWWKELATAKGKKDYDWSHLAMRYWPTRVDKKCQADPSLGVAHGCFWKYHAARAWAWELRLQDEIGPDFRIEEAAYRGDGGHEEHRDKFLSEKPDEACEAVAKELKRRIRKHEAPVTEMRLLEPGIWSAVPDRCWELELATSKKQAAAFRLDAPDAEACRKAFAQANPEQAAVRQELLAGLGSRQLQLLNDDAEDRA